jgi:hypothetical protein
MCVHISILWLWSTFICSFWNISFAQKNLDCLILIQLVWILWAHAWEHNFNPWFWTNPSPVFGTMYDHLVHSQQPSYIGTHYENIEAGKTPVSVKKNELQNYMHCAYELIQCIFLAKNIACTYYSCEIRLQSVIKELMLTYLYHLICEAKSWSSVLFQTTRILCLYLSIIILNYIENDIGQWHQFLGSIENITMLMAWTHMYLCNRTNNSPVIMLYWTNGYRA